VLESWIRPYKYHKEVKEFTHKAITMPLIEWVRRIQKISRCTDIILIVGMIYLDRMMKKFPEKPFCQLNVHRLILVSVMLAAKYFDDGFIFLNNNLFIFTDSNIQK
jgi:hypothetical protein